MIEISERITHVTTTSDANTPGSLESARHAPTGARVTLGFSRSLPLSPGQVVCLRYDLAGNGTFRDCIGIAQPTHTVARRGHLVAFHYRLSHWIANRDRRA